MNLSSRDRRFRDYLRLFLTTRERWLIEERDRLDVIGTWRFLVDRGTRRGRRNKRLTKRTLSRCCKDKIAPWRRYRIFDNSFSTSLESLKTSSIPTFFLQEFRVSFVNCRGNTNNNTFPESRDAHRCSDAGYLAISPEWRAGRKGKMADQIGRIDAEKASICSDEKSSMPRPISDTRRKSRVEYRSDTVVTWFNLDTKAGSIRNWRAHLHE